MSLANPWRIGLFAGVLVVTLGGYAWMFADSPELRTSLGLLTGVFVLGTGAVFLRDRARLDGRVVTANLALGSIVHLGFAALIVGGDRLWKLGVVPAFASNWHHFAIGVLGIAGAFVTWNRARGGNETVPVRARTGEPEPAPPATPELSQEPDWEGLASELRGRSDGIRLRNLQALERISAVLAEPGADRERVRAATRVVRQEVSRLVSESAAQVREAEEDDVLSQAAALLEWGTQKIPELSELDVSDVLMGKAIADIKSGASGIEHVFVDHRELIPIHPITRQTADDKCEERAEAARAALPILEANGMRLSEDLISTRVELEAFRSVTGFQVVELLDGGFVTFEGNGRREALQRAFGEERGVQIEVRLFQFDDPNLRETIDRRVRRVRRWKGLE